MEKRDIIRFIPLEELTFDLDNPRLPRSLDKSESSILEWMLKKENIIELMTSIGEKGFFPGEPILVVFNSEQNKYIVVEGNRRYTASLLLSFPEKAPTKKGSVQDIVSNAPVSPPQSVPALIFSAREEILDYLGYRHITGVEAWDALAKARYLAQLYDRLDSNMNVSEKYRVLARQIGSNAPHVRQLLLGKKLYDVIDDKNFFDIPTLDEKTFEFGSFYTAIIKPNISKYIGIDTESEEPLKDLNAEHLGDLAKWMFEKNSENQTRIGESRNLSTLNKILAPQFSAAFAAFNKGESLKVAAELTDEADELVEKKINEAHRALELAWNYFPKILDYSSLDKEELKEISKLVKLIYDNLVERQQPQNDIDVIL